MSFNIKDGTRPDIRLCDTCKHSQIIKGSQQGQEIVHCLAGGFSRPWNVPFKVVECSDHSAKNSLDRYDAEKIAWIIEVKAGKFMGFVPPKKRED